jgi:ketosteroid isomerase-like protein
MNPAERAAAIARVFETLTAESLARLDEVYAADAIFQDPFNQVRGRAAIRRVFEHMYRQLDAPRFVVLERLADGGRIAFTWDLEYRSRGQTALRRIHGASLLALDAAGLVVAHRDYWDSAGELYEGLPVLGPVLRLIRRRLSATR